MDLLREHRGPPETHPNQWNPEAWLRHIQIMAYSVTIGSGPIIATSHDLIPNGGLVREIPLFQGNLGW